MTLRDCKNTADQCRALGLSVGDTIEGREDCHDGSWEETRLTLLWLGEEVAVWRAIDRNCRRKTWSAPEESADWTLEWRDWRKVPDQPSLSANSSAVVA
jgi:hypothetical protein